MIEHLHREVKNWEGKYYNDTAKIEQKRLEREKKENAFLLETSKAFNDRILKEIKG